MRRASLLPEPLRPVPGGSTTEETRALAKALREPSHDDRQIEGLVSFLKNYPHSRWAPALHLNLGGISYNAGYFQDALTHWKAAWDLAKAGEDANSTELANQGLAEYAKMNARIGRREEVEQLLEEAKHRTLTDDARVKIGGAAEGAWMMKNRPGSAFLCGPFALLSVAETLDPANSKRAHSFVDTVHSPPTGFSIPEVHRLSTELGLKLRIVTHQRHRDAVRGQPCSGSYRAKRASS